MKRILIMLFTLMLSLSFLTGCKHEEEKLYLSDVYEFLNNDSNTYIKVRKEEGDIGVAPGMLKNVSYSNDHDKIKEALTNLNVRIRKTEEQLTPGGNYVEYCFYKNDKDYDGVYIANDLIKYNNTYYEVDKTYNTSIIEAQEIYVLNVYDSNFDVIKNDQKTGTFNMVHELEFIKINELNKEPICKVKNKDFELIIYSENEFSLKLEINDNLTNYYQVVGDLNFKDII